MIGFPPVGCVCVCYFFFSVIKCFSHVVVCMRVCLRAMLLFNDCCLTHASSNASCDTRVCFRSAHFVRAYACMRFVEHYHVWCFSLHICCMHKLSAIACDNNFTNDSSLTYIEPTAPKNFCASHVEKVYIHVYMGLVEESNYICYLHRFGGRVVLYILFT